MTFSVPSRKLFGFTWFLYILFSFILTWRNMIYPCRSYTFLWSNRFAEMNDKWVYGLIQEVTSPFLSPCAKTHNLFPYHRKNKNGWNEDRFYEKFMRKNSIPVKTACDVATLWDFENSLGSVHQHKIGRAAAFYLRSAKWKELKAGHRGVPPSSLRPRCLLHGVLGSLLSSFIVPQPEQALK